MERVGSAWILLRFSLAVVSLSLSIAVAQCPDINLESMDSWTHRTFDDISSSTFKLKDNILRVQSDNSASTLIYKEVFDVYTCPILNFSWKVESFSLQSKGTTKGNDDFPIRIYIAFLYDADYLSWWERRKWSFYETAFGEKPPVASLNYVWAAESYEGVLKNPYTDRSRSFVLNFGKQLSGSWQKHERDIVQDFQRAFKRRPPRKAQLVVMGDSDNTHTTSLAYLKELDLSEVKKVSD